MADGLIDRLSIRIASEGAISRHVWHSEDGKVVQQMPPFALRERLCCRAGVVECTTCYWLRIVWVDSPLRQNITNLPEGTTTCTGKAHRGRVS